MGFLRDSDSRKINSYNHVPLTDHYIEIIVFIILICYTLSIAHCTVYGLLFYVPTDFFNFIIMDASNSLDVTSHETNIRVEDLEVNIIC